MGLDNAGALTYFTVDYRGRTPPTAESGVPVISSANIDQGRVVHEPRRCVSQSIFKEWQKRGIPDEGDLIVTTEGAVGQVALFPAGGPYVLTRRVFACKTNGIDNQFLAYWLHARCNKGAYRFSQSRKHRSSDS